ncbi:MULTISPECIES: hydroxyisourate hydrolase [Martelella]|uniref:5-hydroxyisourate hydrolase n=2 Tax=Martelella TaxID=293088 RepID=A0A5C4JQ26_9HYPH|nr:MULTISPECIES: hydroxyisourate hydrolase [Martelella]MBB4121309.1 5-hydroxyisourate hydrolase [Martelella radicis]TNB47585.1 hydroxyisourate hydrolase [Martelella lutilitoris]
MTGLTTHVLDTALGQPASDMKIDLYRLHGEKRDFIKTVYTNDDGRVDGGPIIAGNDLEVGQYELVFHAGEYLRRSGATLTEPAFLEDIPLRFAIADVTAHYHVPLLLSAHAFSTYRGS